MDKCLAQEPAWEEITATWWISRGAESRSLRENMAVGYVYIFLPTGHKQMPPHHSFCLKRLSCCLGKFRTSCSQSRMARRKLMRRHLCSYKWIRKLWASLTSWPGMWMLLKIDESWWGWALAGTYFISNSKYIGSTFARIWVSSKWRAQTML